MFQKKTFNFIALFFIIPFFGVGSNIANAQSIPQKQTNSTAPLPRKTTVDIPKPITINYPTQPVKINLDNPITINAPSNNNWLTNAKDIATLLTSLFGFGTLCFGLWSYNNQNKWKRLEFLAQKYKEFEEDPKINNVLWMLDWEKKELPFRELGSNDAISLEYNTETLVQAFENKESYTGNEANIRECFDEFLRNLDRFNLYINAGVVNAKDLEPYLEYWLKIIANTQDAKNHKTLDFYKNLWYNFIYKYGFKTEEILKKFNIKSNIPEAENPEEANQASQS
jgi:hypothetical protein